MEGFSYRSRWSKQQQQQQQEWWMLQIHVICTLTIIKLHQPQTFTITGGTAVPKKSMTGKGQCTRFPKVVKHVQSVSASECTKAAKVASAALRIIVLQSK